MSVFKSWRDYWNFSHIVKQKNRYIYGESIEKFLEVVVATSKSREVGIKKGAKLWRAQRGCAKRVVADHETGGEYEENCPYPPERMKPIKGEASEGRVNPRGIPCLYLSKDRDTALSEVRPWLGALISVGQFKVLRNLKVIDCSKDLRNPCFYLNEPPPADREKCVWSDINQAFSEPVNPHDPVAEYVPTQIIAEVFKTKGFDGIVYKSSYGEGLNIVLFDLDVAKMLKCSPYELKELKFNFSKCGNPYFCK